MYLPTLRHTCSPQLWGLFLCAPGRQLGLSRRIVRLKHSSQGAQPGNRKSGSRIGPRIGSPPSHLIRSNRIGVDGSVLDWIGLTFPSGLPVLQAVFTCFYLFLQRYSTTPALVKTNICSIYSIKYQLFPCYMVRYMQYFSYRETLYNKTTKKRNKNNSLRKYNEYR